LVQTELCILKSWLLSFIGSAPPGQNYVYWDDVHARPAFASACQRKQGSTIYFRGGCSVERLQRLPRPLRRNATRRDADGGRVRPQFPTCFCLSVCLSYPSSLPRAARHETYDSSKFPNKRLCLKERCRLERGPEGRPRGGPVGGAVGGGLKGRIRSFIAHRGADSPRVAMTRQCQRQLFSRQLLPRSAQFNKVAQFVRQRNKK